VQSETEHTAPYRVGRLRGDITVSMGLDKKSVSIGNTGLIDYAVYVYYGTMDYATGPVPPKPYKKVAGRKKGIRPNYYLDNALERLVSSGRLERILGKHADNFSEAVFDDIIRNLTQIRVK